MSDTGHTPGPWYVSEATVGGRVVRRMVHDSNRSGRGHKPIAELHAGFTCFEADARLIAAAPRMYGYIAKCAERGDEEAAAILEEIDAADPHNLGREIEGGDNPE